MAAAASDKTESSQGRISKISKILTQQLSILTPNDVMVLMIHETSARRSVHDYIDTAFPDLGHVSIVCPGMLNSGHCNVILKTCWHCDHKNVALSTYYYGDLENNKDESYGGTCTACGDFCRWEPNYDSRSSVIYVPQRNIMIVGALLKGFQHKKWKIKKTAQELGKSVDDIKTLKQLIIIKLGVEEQTELEGFGQNAKRLVKFVTKLVPDSFRMSK